MSKELLGIKGIITVLNTPFTKTDRIDLMSLERNVEYAIGSGVAGFLVPAMASEVEKLSISEREDIVQTVVRKVNGRVPVIGGASSGDRTERHGIAQRLTAMGCNGILVSMPFRDFGQYEHELRALAEGKPGFIMIQDWDFNGYGIPVDAVTKLFQEVDCFKSLKIEVVPAGAKYTEVLEKTCGKLHIAGGWAVMQIIEALDRGVHAFMPTGIHEVYTSIYNLYHHNERKAARVLFDKLLPVLAFSNQHLDISIHFFKRLLYRQGIYDTPLVRRPISVFDQYHERIADELIEYLLQMMNADPCCRYRAYSARPL